MGLMNVRRFWVAGVVLTATIALLPFSFHAERHLETATRVEGSEAESVRQELATRFRSPFVDRVVLVVQGLPPADSEEGEQALATIVARLRDEPGVSGVVSYLELRDPIFLGRGGGTFVLVGLASTEGPVESLVPKLHELATSLQNQLRTRYPAVKLELTGEIPLNFDIRKASADDVRRGESLVIPATLALLLVAFGSLVAALIPLAVGQLAIAATLAITGLLAQRWHLSILVQNLATMLGLGLGIDYALLMVSRFREAISAGHDGSAASVIAAASGRSYAVDLGLDRRHRIPGPPDGPHQRNPFHRCRRVPGGGNVCVAHKYRRSRSAGFARSANRCWPNALYSQAGFAPGRTYRKSLAAMGKGDRRPSMACPPSGRRPIASARLAGHATRYQSPQRGLASGVGGISPRAAHPGTNGPGRRRLFDARHRRAASRTPLPKPTRDGTRSIVSPSASRATLVAPA